MVPIFLPLMFEKDTDFFFNRENKNYFEVFLFFQKQIFLS